MNAINEELDLDESDDDEFDESDKSDEEYNKDEDFILMIF